MALFWDEKDVAAAVANPGEHADMVALQSLLYDDEDRDFSAENLKVQGNEALRKGKKFYSHAVDFYTQALDVQSENAALNSTILSNRAHVQLLMGNHGRALEDARASLKLDASNLKSRYRAVKACVTLGKYEAAIAFCEEGKRDGGAAEELRSLEASARKGLEERRTRRAALQTRLNQLSALSSAIMGGGDGRKAYTMAKPTTVTKNNFSADDQVPRLSPDAAGGALEWSVVIVHPEFMQVDMVRDVNETHSVGHYIEQIFGEGPPPWDERGDYTRERVELYCQRHESASGTARNPTQYTTLTTDVMRDEDELTRYFMTVDVAYRGLRDAMRRGGDGVQDDAEEEKLSDMDEGMSSSRVAPGARFARPSWTRVHEFMSVRDILTKDDGHVVQGLPGTFCDRKGARRLVPNYERVRVNVCIRKLSANERKTYLLAHVYVYVCVCVCLIAFAYIYSFTRTRTCVSSMLFPNDINQRPPSLLRGCKRQYILQ